MINIALGMCVCVGGGGICLIKSLFNQMKNKLEFG